MDDETQLNDSQVTSTETPRRPLRDSLGQGFTQSSEGRSAEHDSHDRETPNNADSAARANAGFERLFAAEAEDFGSHGEASADVTNSQIHSYMEVLLQHWISESSVPELLPNSLTVSRESQEIFSRYHATEQALSEMSIDLDPHRRLTLALHEKAARRMNRVLRHYKFLRATKILRDPCFALSLHASAVTQPQSSGETPIEPLDSQEIELAKRTNELLTQRALLLPDHSDLRRTLHFEVSIPELPHSDLLSSVDSATIQAQRLLEALKQNTESAAANKHRRNLLEKKRPPGSRRGNHDPDLGQLRQVVPQGSTLTLEYEILRELVFQESFKVVK